MNAAIIVAAGSSRRMGFDKLTAPLNGRTVLATTIQVFLDCDQIHQLIVVCSPERSEQVNVTHKKLSYVEGGEERHFSVANGLKALQEKVEYVLIHDGARPMVTKDQITSTIESAKESGAAVLARPVTETLKRVNEEATHVEESVDRNCLWVMETPQTFKKSLIEASYTEIRASDELVTDEVSAIEKIGVRTVLVQSYTPNIKITYAEDLELVKKLMS